jgi:flagellar hook protein FlgE
MGLTSALYTGLSGLNANQARIDTIGNNIANVNTTAFKGSRTLFQTQFYEVMNSGTPPTDATGGTNPLQVGHGTVVANTTQNFNNGPIETTGIASDLAIEGNGFFVLRTGDNSQRFTRDGSFFLDADNHLVSQDGYYVQGYGVDDEFNINPAVVSDLTVPVGSETIARRTSEVILDGDLSSSGVVAGASSESRSQQLVDGGGNPATAATLLTDLRSFDTPAVTFLANGDSLSSTGVTKGDRELPTETFVVGTTGTTLGDYTAWLEQTLGIQNGPGLPGNPGVTVEAGEIVVRGNAGEQNNVEVQPGDILSSNAVANQPFQFTQTADSTGSGIYTAFTVYDSLGTPVQAQVTFALEEKTNQGATWRFYVESPDNEGVQRAIGNGTIEFDTEGNVRNTTGTQVTVSRDSTGAEPPLSFTLDLSGIHGLSTKQSNVIMFDQNGYPPGSLNGFSVDKTGTITGVFSNGLSRNLGQVAIATFPNSQGMVQQGENLYTAGPNAGNFALTTAGNLGAGYVRSGSLEMSNVDLGSEFIGLVTATTGFQAASRVITTSSDMLQQLLSIVR